jgi:hypothetical protein
MQQDCKNNPQQKRAYRSDTLGEAFEASAAAYSDLSDALGEAWRPLQEEAYESYCAREAEMVKRARQEKFYLVDF